MKIGDKIRFLNEVGGGIIKGFQGKDTVLVEDEDGFEIPVLRRECIVVETNELNFEKRADNLSPVNSSAESTIPSAAPDSPTKGSHTPSKKETEETAHKERPEGERLNVSISFVPTTIERLSHSDFDVYLINDSNYCLDFNYMTAEGESWRVVQNGISDPNTKVLIDNLEHDDLNRVQRICVQLIAYKEQKTFQLKSPQSIELRLDLTKFYKLHTFEPNNFFEERVLTYEVLKNDLPPKRISINPDDMRESLMGMRNKPEHAATPSHPRIHAVAIRKGKGDNVEVVDLHASELLDTLRGMNNGDILDYQLDVFKRKMNEHLSHKGQKIVFIHGKGNGVLRNALLRELRHSYKNCTSQDASFREYGFGATLVIIH